MTTWTITILSSRLIDRKAFLRNPFVLLWSMTTTSLNLCWKKIPHLLSKGSQKKTLQGQTASWERNFLWKTPWTRWCLRLIPRMAKFPCNISSLQFYQKIALPKKQHSLNHQGNNRLEWRTISQPRKLSCLIKLEGDSQMYQKRSFWNKKMWRLKRRNFCWSILSSMWLRSFSSSLWFL